MCVCVCMHIYNIYTHVYVWIPGALLQYLLKTLLSISETASIISRNSIWYAFKSSSFWLLVLWIFVVICVCGPSWIALTTSHYQYLVITLYGTELDIQPADTGCRHGSFFLVCFIIYKTLISFNTTMLATIFIYIHCLERKHLGTVAVPQIYRTILHHLGILREKSSFFCANRDPKLKQASFLAIYFA